MAQPPKYERTKDFTVDYGNNTDHRALNKEFDGAAQSINAIRANLAKIQRDDGALKNGIVTIDSLAPSTLNAMTQAAQAVIQPLVTQAQTAATSSNNAALAAEASKNAAAASASSAAASAGSAGNSLRDVRNAYYGARVTDPDVRPDGSAMQAGDRYFNTASKVEKTYDGAAWVIQSVWSLNLANPNDAGQGDALVAVKLEFDGAASRTQHDKNADFVTLKDAAGAVLGGVGDNTLALQKAAAAVGEGGTVYLPAGRIRFTGAGVVILPVNLVGAGQGATILEFDNSGAGGNNGIIFVAPTKRNVQFGLTKATVKTVAGNGNYALTTPRGAGLNRLYPKPTFEFISFAEEDAAAPSGFPQAYSWKFMFLAGDSWCFTLRGIDALGCYKIADNPAAQFLDGFVRSDPAEGILSMRVSNITTHNVANFFEIRQKTYISFSDVDVAQAYNGVYDAPDRVFETNPYGYGESIWNNVIINAQRNPIKLKNRFDLIINGLVLHRAAGGYDHGLDWIGLDLEKPRITRIFGLEAGSASGYSGNKVGMRVDGGDDNVFHGLSFGTLDVCAQVGITGSANGAAQAVQMSAVSINANVTKVFDIQNARGFKCHGFSKTSGFNYTTFATYGDTTSRLNSEFVNCPATGTISYDTQVALVGSGAGTDLKRWLIDTSSGFTLQTRTDADGIGNNALIIARAGAVIDRVELRTKATTGGFVFCNAPETHFGGLIKPATDNAFSAGNASFRFSEVHAGNGTIITSDEREKTLIGDIDAAAIRAVRRVRLKQFKFIDAVSEKGDGARWHFGAIAQQIKESFEAEGLDPFAYGVLCYDEWDEQPEVSQYHPATEVVTDEEGNVVEPAREEWTEVVVPYRQAGNRYGVRYDELMCLMMASMLSV